MLHGIRGIFLGFDINQKGYVFSSPGTHQIYISGDVLFDESFGTAIATNWQMHQDSLALRPLKSITPTADATLEHTGSIADFPIIAKEGNITPATTLPIPIATLNDDGDDDNGDVPHLLHPDDDSSASTSSSDTELELDMDDDILDIEAGNLEDQNEIIDTVSPQPLSYPLRRSTRIRKPNSRYAYYTRRYDWVGNASATDLDLAVAFASEAVTALPSTNDALLWEPAPRSIRDILKIPEGPVCQAWLKSVWKD